MASLDLFLLLSRREAFGLVLVEAMAAGIPVITSEAGGGPREVVGQDGIVLEQDDPTSIAAHVVALLRDDTRREALAAAGRRRAQSYDVALAAHRLEDTYVQVLTNGYSNGH
jgi:glycosyltransferase involved in cell wall biosynthesis